MAHVQNNLTTTASSPYAPPCTYARPRAVALLDAHWHQRKGRYRYHQQLTRGIALFAGFCKRNLRMRGRRSDDFLYRRSDSGNTITQSRQVQNL
ncbi:hypothetical protein KCP69_07105 [Salmonella enterica subsp. enterica]|nr:hypothetical protein KCP69_07105 [Salmonella enterica subsp. enterica]